MAKNTELFKYIERTDHIRDLSNPQIRDIASADDYSTELQKNFKRIGELAKENIELLSEYYDPMVRSDDPLTREQVEEAWSFSGELCNANTVNWFDVMVQYTQMSRLLEDARSKQDTDQLIRALDGFLTASYSLMYITMRLSIVSDLCTGIRDKGLQAGYELISFLDKEKFAALSDKSKETVLTDARYIRALFEREGEPVSEEVNEKEMHVLRNALQLAEDPFYREQLPGYDWRIHEYRTLDYMSTLTEKYNLRGFSHAHVLEINDSNKRLIRLWESDPAFFGTRDSRTYLELSRLRNEYLAGETDLATYRHALVELQRQHEENDYSATNNLIAMLAPLEYLLTLDKEHLSAEEEAYLNDFYRQLIVRMHRMPKKGSLSFILTYLMTILETFIEVPDGLTFETFGLHLMAAIHPPTYAHSLSVAAISECLVRHLLSRSPELFIGIPGMETVDDVKKSRKQMERFTYHAALCHDFGKLAMIETIMTYGRNLHDLEFDIIRTHPAIGASLLKQHASTAPYASVALGHHRFFDDSAGYPETYHSSDSTEQTVIAVVACADCLDAATDSIGRSYKEGKPLDRYIGEVRSSSGTRYAPYLDDLLRDPGVVLELEYLISGGRDENYRKTYRILKEHDV